MKKRGNTRLFFLCCKRLFDILGSLLLLVLFLPVFLLIPLLIAADSKGDIIFMQIRAGKYNKPFVLYKFRSMLPSAPHDTATGELTEASAYITPIGRFLRRTSLDELPQLWNILKGDMSFVGPRPVVLTETELLARRRQLGADRVRPGLTGLAQVRGRDTVAWKHKARYDAYYARHACARLDGRILWDTLRCVVTGDGLQEGSEAPTPRRLRTKRQKWRAGR